MQDDSFWRSLVWDLEDGHAPTLWLLSGKMVARDYGCGRMRRSYGDTGSCSLKQLRGRLRDPENQVRGAGLKGFGLEAPTYVL